jgi:hypothetical protein
MFGNPAEVEPEDWHTLAAEQEVDSVLADSFPASDPPSWTCGITRVQEETPSTGESKVQHGETTPGDIRLV